MYKSGKLTFCTTTTTTPVAELKSAGLVDFAPHSPLPGLSMQTSPARQGLYWHPVVLFQISFLVISVMQSPHWDCDVVAGA